jgi:hypothetical protein
MGHYRKTKRRNRKTLLPRRRRQPGRLRVKDLRKLPWWSDPIVLSIINAKARP